MKNKKYVMCSGLAFSDDEDMEILHQYALEGWIFREFKWLCYVLYKEEPQDLIFSYDMQKIKKKDEVDYLQMFESTGWYKIPCKDDTIHFFYAQNGTKPLHTEQQTRKEQFLMPFYVSIVLLAIGLALFLSMRWIDVHAWLAGIAGGLIGGGLMLFMGCAFRLKNRKLRISLSFQKARLFMFMGIGLWILGKGIKYVWSPLGSVIAIIGCMMAIFGLCYVLTQYRLYKDKKEIGGKIDD
ncbi:DUF2812 domain-containing protein [[Eubacterium] hominis]|uniref:DUF2812 domain-containing protein n=1 Tax=[Eubacterium] hominis TaxID=2764325 RepID=UPI003A4D3A60